MKIENAKVENYSAFWVEKYRPPSKGGNTKAFHSHVLTIEGEKYSFLALGTKQWVYKSDTVSFEFEIKNKYKNIKKDTIETLDKEGNKVKRGNRGFKKKLRTAETRMPVSRREMNR